MQHNKSLMLKNHILYNKYYCININGDPHYLKSVQCFVVDFLNKWLNINPFLNECQQDLQRPES